MSFKQKSEIDDVDVDVVCMCIFVHCEMLKFDVLGRCSGYGMLQHVAVRSSYCSTVNNFSL